MSLQNTSVYCTFILLSRVNIVFSFDTSFRGGTHISSILMTVHVLYGTTKTCNQLFFFFFFALVFWVAQTKWTSQAKDVSNHWVYQALLRRQSHS